MWNRSAEINPPFPEASVVRLQVKASAGVSPAMVEGWKVDSVGGEGSALTFDPRLAVVTAADVFPTSLGGPAAARDPAGIRQESTAGLERRRCFQTRG